jgi:hypothetical protein
LFEILLLIPFQVEALVLRQHLLNRSVTCRKLGISLPCICISSKCQLAWSCILYFMLYVVLELK